MTSSPHTKILGAKCNQYLRENLPHDSPIKRLAKIIGQSRQTAARLYAGDAPTSSQMASLAAHFGPDFIAYTFDPVIGQSSAITRRAALERIERSLGALAASLDELRECDYGEQRLTPAVANSIALVAVHKPLADLAQPSLAPLRRHLDALSRGSRLDDLSALARSDVEGRTGVAYRQSGEDWIVLPARDNRLWTTSPSPRSIAAYSGNVVDLRRDLEDALRAHEPVLVNHAGALYRNGQLQQFHSAVIRVGGRTKCGVDVVVTDFVRLAS